VSCGDIFIGTEKIILFIPFLFGNLFFKEGKPSRHAFLKFAVLGIFVIALIFSYSRAAWLSVGAAVMVYIVILLRIKFRWLAMATIVVVSGFFVFQTEIFENLEQNSSESSTNFADHLRSITNISSDASNLERINRWQSALRMFREHPFWGTGPGTYQFLYAPYQLSKEKTIISTNAGDRGNAHSEYIGPLTESGVLGMLTFLAIIVCVIYTAIRLYRRAEDRRVRFFSLVLVLGLITYYVHGTLNNFLDSDKASVPFWGFTAIIVAMDLYHRKKEPAKKDIS
jgi:O-antigen ligase